MDTEETRRPFLAPRTPTAAELPEPIPFPQQPGGEDIYLNIVNFGTGISQGVLADGTPHVGVWVELTTAEGRRLRWSMTVREAEGTADLIRKSAKRATRANRGPKS